MTTDDDTIQPRQAVARPIDVLMSAIGILLCVGLFLLFGVVQDVRDDLDAAEQKELRTRAALCDLTRAIGAPEPAPCALSNVTGYRDGSIQPSSAEAPTQARMTRELLCIFLQQRNLTLPPEQRFAVPSVYCPEA